MRLKRISLLLFLLFCFSFSFVCTAAEERQEITVVCHEDILTKAFVVPCGDTEELDRNLSFMLSDFQFIGGTNEEQSIEAPLTLDYYEHDIDIDTPGTYSITVYLKIEEPYNEEYFISDETRTLTITVYVSDPDIFRIYPTDVSSYFYEYQWNGDIWNGNARLEYLEISPKESLSEAELECAEWKTDSDDSMAVYSTNMVRIFSDIFNQDCNYYIRIRIGDITSRAEFLQFTEYEPTDDEGIGGNRDGSDYEEDTFPPTTQSPADDPDHANTPDDSDCTVDSQPAGSGSSDSNPTGSSGSDSTGSAQTDNSDADSAGDNQSNSTDQSSAKKKRESASMGNRENNSTAISGDDSGSSSDSTGSGSVSASRSGTPGTSGTGSNISSDTSAELFDGSLLQITGARLNTMIAENQKYVSFAWQDVNLLLPCDLLKSWNVKDSSLFTVKIKKHSSASFSITVTLDGSEIADIPEASIQFSMNDPGTDAVLLLNGDKVDISVTYENGYVSFSTNTTGTYQICQPEDMSFNTTDFTPEPGNALPDTVESRHIPVFPLAVLVIIILLLVVTYIVHKGGKLHV